MKNARHYEKKTRRLLDALHKRWPDSAPPPWDGDRIWLLILSVLEGDATRKQAEQARAALEKEFVDCNEVRVAPAKEIAECISHADPAARPKAAMLSKVLNGLFKRANAVSLDFLEDKTKRDIRRRLLELGLDTYAAAAVTLFGFGGHAVPVDQALADYLEMNGCIYPGSELGDVQGFLERIIPQKDAAVTHELFRRCLEASAKPLARWRKAAAAKRAAAARAAARAARRKAAPKKARKPKRPEKPKTPTKPKEAKTKRLGKK